MVVCCEEQCMLWHLGFLLEPGGGWVMFTIATVAVTEFFVAASCFNDIDFHWFGEVSTLNLCLLNCSMVF